MKPKLLVLLAVIILYLLGATYKSRYRHQVASGESAVMPAVMPFTMEGS